jgi:hypothetical protein
LSSALASLSATALSPALASALGSLPATALVLASASALGSLPATEKARVWELYRYVPSPV